MPVLWRFLSSVFLTLPNINQMNQNQSKIFDLQIQIQFLDTTVPTKYWIHEGTIHTIH